MKISSSISNYSDNHIESAEIWATRFNIPEAYKNKFMNCLLSHTSYHSYFWCYSFSKTEVIARFGCYLLYFDGQKVWSLNSDKMQVTKSIVT